MRTAQIFSFIRDRAPRDWSAQDVAEFYRVEAALIQAGLRVSSARGLTDEGEPWFVFCRSDDDEIIIHFARIDGRYVISSPAYCGNATGYDFRDLVRDTIERHPVLRAKPSGGNLFLHPAALLVMLVATAFLKAGSAAEAASAHGTTAAADAAGEAKTRSATPAPVPAMVALDPTQETLLLSAISAAIMTPMPAHTLTATPSPTPPPPDISDPQHAWPDSAMLLDKSGDAPAAGLREMSFAASPQGGMTVTAVETTANASAHAASFSGDALALRPGGPDAVHVQPPAVLSFPVVMPPADVAANPAANVQFVSLSSLSDIPQADKVLLLALGVSDTVAYAPVAPEALSSVIHANAHTTAVTAHTDTASTQVAITPATSQFITDTGIAPVSTAIPGSVTPGVLAPAGGPDISAVLAIVQQFQAIEVQPAVLLSAHGAIFYDAYEINTNYSAVKSVTYDFGDGFSISLVGIPVELTHAGAHV